MYLLLCECASGGQRLPWGMFLNHSPPFYVLRQDWLLNQRFIDWLGWLANEFQESACLCCTTHLLPSVGLHTAPTLLPFGHLNSGPRAHTANNSRDWITFPSLQNGINEVQRAPRSKDIWLFKCPSENTDLRSHLGFWFLEAVKRKCEEEGKRRGRWEAQGGASMATAGCWQQWFFSA